MSIIIFSLKLLGVVSVCWSGEVLEKDLGGVSGGKKKKPIK
jgi:hypothetical protein